jgi:deoxyribonuclease V
VKLVHRQRWDVTPKEAVQIQRRLREKLARLWRDSTRLSAPLPRNPLIAGADISYDKGSDKLFAAVVVMRMVGKNPSPQPSPQPSPPHCGGEGVGFVSCGAKSEGGQDAHSTFEIVETATVVDRARFPYVPGLLSFREAPVLLKCFRKLRCTPDVVMIDGHGLAHPRRFGIACHIGWLLNVPTIGCGKSILVGEYKRLQRCRGATAALIHKGEAVGCAVRTRTGVQPVYISIGHRIDLPTAVRLTLRCAPRFRIPEPTRQAHLLVNQLRLAARRL